MTEGEDNPELKLKALTTSLDHARIMSNHSAEIRMRNFNFFVVMTAALIAGIVKLAEPVSGMLEIVGVFSSCLFLGVDFQVCSYLEYNLGKVKYIEPLIWDYAELADRKRLEAEPSGFFFSLLYRSFFIVAGLAWAIAYLSRFISKS